MSQPEQAEGAAKRWRGVRALTVDLAVRPQAAMTALPRSLELAEPPVAALVVASFPGNEVGPAFREVAVVFGVADASGPASFCPWSVVDDFAAVVLGPEVFGVPRQMGRIAFEVGEDSLTASLWISGVQVLAVSADFGAEDSCRDHVYGGRITARSDTSLATTGLVERRHPIETIRTTRVARVSVSIDEGADDLGALGMLVATEGSRGRLVELDLDLSADAGVGAGDDVGGDSGESAATDVERVPQLVFTGIGAASVLIPLYTTLG